MSGHGICRLVTLCSTVTQLVSENDRRLPGAESNDDSDSDSDGDDDDIEELSPEKKEEVQR